MSRSLTSDELTASNQATTLRSNRFEATVASPLSEPSAAVAPHDLPCL